MSILAHHSHFFPFPRIFATSMSKKAVIALCITILLPVISYLVVKTVSEDAVKMPRRYFPENITETIVDGKRVSDTVWHQLNNITLVNQMGDTVSLNDLRGKIVVADFFFTRCPTICPYLTRNMAHIQNALKLRDITRPVDTSFVHFVSFSVDPERDTVEALQRYATKFGVNDDLWWMLTGPKKAIYDFALEEVKLGLQDGEGIDTSFVHTSKFVLIDKKGVVRGLQEVEPHAADHERCRLAHACAVIQVTMAVADQAQEVRSAALTPAHIRAVVDETGEVRVLEVHAHRQDMAQSRLILDQPSGKVWPRVFGVRLRHRSSRSLAARRSGRAASSSQGRPKRSSAGCLR